MEILVHTLLCKVCVILLTLVPVVNSATCPSGPVTYCTSTNMQYLGITASKLFTGQTAASCRDQCLADQTCKAVTFISGPGACTLYDTNHLTAGTLLAKSGIDYYYYICGGATCASGEGTIIMTSSTTQGPTTTTTTNKATTTTTSTTKQPTTATTTTQATTTTAKSTTTASKTTTLSNQGPRSTTTKQPGYKTTSTPGGRMTPQEFWTWVRDEPVWLTMIGMGLVIFFEFITIMYLFCRLNMLQNHRKHKHEED